MPPSVEGDVLVFVFMMMCMLMMIPVQVSFNAAGGLDMVVVILILLFGERFCIKDAHYYLLLPCTFKTRRDVNEFL